MKKKIILILLLISVSVNVLYLGKTLKNKADQELLVGTFQTEVFSIDQSIPPIYTIILQNNEFTFYTGDNKIKLKGNYILDEQYIRVSIDNNDIVGQINSSKEFVFPVQYDNNVFVLTFKKVSDYPITVTTE